MSTTYGIHGSPLHTIEVTEHSSLLDIDMTNLADETTFSIDDLSAQDIAHIALELLKVVSYVDGDLLDVMQTADPYVVAELRRALV